jgi:hypothetical protein
MGKCRLKKKLGILPDSLMAEIAFCKGCHPSSPRRRGHFLKNNGIGEKEQAGTIGALLL